MHLCLLLAMMFILFSLEDLVKILDYPVSHLMQLNIIG